MFIGMLFPQRKPSFLFFRYFLSYILILFVVLAAVCTIVYSNFIITLQKEVESSNISALQHVNVNIDTRLRELERIALHMNSNPNLQPYKMLFAGYDSLESINEIKKYESSNEFIFDIALYHTYNGNQKIYNASTEVSLDIFFEYMYKYKTWGLNEFLDMYGGIRLPVIRPVEQVITDNVKERYIATYIYPLPPNTSKPLSFVFFMIDKSAFEILMKDVLNEYTGYVYILDNNNTPLFYTGEDRSGVNALDILDMVDINDLEPNGNTRVIEKEKYSVTKIISDYNQWSYITIMRTEQLLNKVYTKKTLFNITVLILFLAGIIAAFALAAANYKPLRNLMNIISKQNIASQNSHTGNEFSIITNAIVDAANKNRWLMEELRSKAGFMKTQLLLGLLKGRFGTLDEITSLIDISGLKLNHPYFQVVVIYFDDYKLFENKEDDQTKKLIKFSMVNIVEELAGQIGHGYALELEDDRKIALLLNIPDNSIEKSSMDKLVSQIKEFFNAHYGLTLTFGVGRVYSYVDEISESFLEACRAVYYRLLKGNNSVIYYEDIHLIRQTEITYPVELESKLIMAVKQGKIVDVELISTEIVQYIENEITTPESAQCIYFGIINSLMKSLNEMEIGTEVYFGREWESLYMHPLETIKDLGNRIIDFCRKICTYIEKSKESKNFDLRNHLFSIIDENYCDKMLSIDMLAEKSGMSKSYICRYFRDQTGYSLMQYIDSMRFSKIKKLLKETKIPLASLISQVGYIDESSFIRKFKKKEGMTPAQYRKIVQNDSKA